MTSVAKGNSCFSAKFHKEVANPNENVVFSPFSVTNAIALVNAGGDGKTKAEIDAVFGFNSTTNDDFKTITVNIAKSESLNSSVSIANKCFAHSGGSFQLKPEYSQLLNKNYSTEIGRTDFSNKDKAASEINTYIEDKTNNKIKNLISPDSIQDNTGMILVNAIYFKGQWENKFGIMDTRKAEFHLNAKEKIETDTMFIYNQNFQVGSLEDLKMKFVEIPYKGQRLSMLVYLPEEYDLTLPSSTPQETLGKSSQEKVNVALPKFKIDSKFDLSAILKEIGIHEAFTEDANFSGISDSPLFIASAIQKAMIEVNEEGTEAAASTGFGMGITNFVEPMEFTVNKPFGFQIIDKELNLVLFEGRVNNPSI